MNNLMIRWFMLVNGRVNDGWKFQWHCYGNNARSIEGVICDNGIQEMTSTICYDTKTFEVYNISVHCFDSDSLDNSRSKAAIFFTDEKHKKAYAEESELHDAAWDQAWSGVFYEEVKSFDDLVKFIHDSHYQNLDDPEKFDVVVDTLKKHHDKLWQMTQRNMNSEFIGMNIMDDIRLEQMGELKQAMQLWKDFKNGKALRQN